MEGDDTELDPSARVSDETAAVAQEAVSEDTALAPETPEAETAILADEKVTKVADALAWSEYAEAGPTEPAPYVVRRPASRWAIVVAAVAVPLVAIAALGMVVLHGKNHDRPVPPVATSTSTAPAEAVPPVVPLNGRYRLVIDYPHQTTHNTGNLGPPDTPPVTEYWLFTTTCNTNCIAHGYGVNHETGQPVPITPGHKPPTITLTYVDGAWRQLIPDTNGSIVCTTGERTQFSDSWQFTPAAPDGSLQGTDTGAFPLGACGRDAMWVQTPLHLERV